MNKTDTQPHSHRHIPKFGTQRQTNVHTHPWLATLRIAVVMESNPLYESGASLPEAAPAHGMPAASGMSVGGRERVKRERGGVERSRQVEREREREREREIQHGLMVTHVHMHVLCIFRVVLRQPGV